MPFIFYKYLHILYGEEKKMKIIRLVVVIALALSLLFSGFYLKILPKLENKINAYIVQVGIYKQEENANEMINKLTQLQQPNYKYQKDNNFVVITGVFLDEQEAKNMGNSISENGITCVIKSIQLSSNLKSSIEQQNYELIIKELSS